MAKMPTLRICRICLRTEAKGYNYERYQLKYFYEEVTALKVADNDDLPQWFCYECATILLKFHKFKEKCYVGQKCLKEMLRRGPITYEAIYKLDRATKQLKSTLERFILSDRVKTFTIIDKKVRNKIDEENDTEAKCNVKIENNSDQKSNKILEISEVPKHKNNKELPVNSNNCEEFVENFRIIEHDVLSCDNHKVGDENNGVNILDHRSSDENHKFCDERCDDEPLESVVDKPSTVDIISSNNQTLCAENLLDNPSSPNSILVQEDKVVIPKRNKLKKNKTRNLEIDTSLKEFGKFLCEENWRKVVLTEEEALEEFRKKAEDAKYLDAGFKCTDCFKGFSKKEMLFRHTQSRHSEELGRYECRFCRMRFKWHCLLRKHIQQHYTRYQCLLCQLSFNLDTSAVLHEEYHSGAPRSCGHCGQQFRHVTTYYTHMRTHRSAHVCVMCGASFVSSAGLKLHVKRKHSVLLSDVMGSPSSDDDDDSPSELHCTRCDIRFRSRRAYTEHLFHSDMHTEVIKEEQDDVTPSKKIMGKRLREKITKELGKRKSDLEITSPVKVKRRNKKNSKWHTKPSTCYQCGEHFSTQAACLKHHVTAHPRTSFHDPSQRHICELCGASLAPGSVALHQNMHSRELVFSCSVCARDFYSKISLQRHLRTHTGEKPFGCPLCEKRFTQSNSMKLHYRTFHLKQPYPKRNRNKKYPPQSAETEAFAEESDSVSQLEPPPEVQPEARPPPEVHKHLHDDNMGLEEENIHYLTLS